MRQRALFGRRERRLLRGVRFVCRARDVELENMMCGALGAEDRFLVVSS